MDYARKQIELQMKVTADAKQAEAAVDSIRKKFGEAAAAAAELNNRVARFNQTATFAGQAGNSFGLAGRTLFGTPQIGADGTYEGRKGGILSAGGVAGMAAIAATAQTAAEVQRAWVQLDNSMLSTRDKITGFAQAIPLIGDSLKRLGDGVLDMAGRLADPDQARRVNEQRVRQATVLSQQQTLSDARMKEFGLRGEVSAAGFNRRALEAFPTVASGQALLTRSVGGVAGSFLSAGLGAVDPRLQGGLEAVQAAKQQANAAVMAEMEAAREARGARLVAGGAMRDWRRARGETGAAEEAARGEGAQVLEYGRRAGLGNFGVGLAALGVIGPGSRQNLQEKVLAEQQALAAAQQKLAEAEQKVTDHKQKQLATARAIHEASKAQTDLMKTQLQIMDERIARSRGAAAEFGAMDSVDQAGLLQITRKFKEGGRDALTKDEFGILSGTGLAKDLIGQRAERDGADSPMFKELRDLLGLADAATEQKARNAFKTELDMKVQFDKEQLALTLQKTLETMNLKQILGEIVAAQVEVNLRRPELGAAGAMAGLQ